MRIYARAGDKRNEIQARPGAELNLLVGNIWLLKETRRSPPTSVYDLARRCDMDASNLNKLVRALGKLGALTVTKKVSGGRVQLEPRVEYSRIEIDFDKAPTALNARSRFFTVTRAR